MVKEDNVLPCEQHQKMPLWISQLLDEDPGQYNIMSNELRKIL